MEVSRTSFLKNDGLANFDLSLINTIKNITELDDLKKNIEFLKVNIDRKDPQIDYLKMKADGAITKINKQREIIISDEKISSTRSPELNIIYNILLKKDIDGETDVQQLTRNLDHIKEISKQSIGESHENFKFMEKEINDLMKLLNKIQTQPKNITSMDIDDLIDGLRNLKDLEARFGDIAVNSNKSKNVTCMFAGERTTISIEEWKGFFLDSFLKKLDNRINRITDELDIHRVKVSSMNPQAESLKNQLQNSQSPEANVISNVLLKKDINGTTDAQKIIQDLIPIKKVLQKCINETGISTHNGYRGFKSLLQLLERLEENLNKLPGKTTSFDTLKDLTSCFRSFKNLDKEFGKASVDLYGSKTVNLEFSIEPSTIEEWKSVILDPFLEQLESIGLQFTEVLKNQGFQASFINSQIKQPIQNPQSVNSQQRESILQELRNIRLPQPVNDYQIVSDMFDWSVPFMDGVLNGTIPAPSPLHLQQARFQKALGDSQLVNQHLIIPNVYVGNYAALQSVDSKKGNNPLKFTRIISVTNLQADKAIFAVDVPQNIERTVALVHDQDESWEELKLYFDRIFKMIDEARDSGESILIHCSQGESRSVTVLMAYMINRFGLTPAQALTYIKSKRLVAQPIPGLMNRLEQYYNEVRT